MSEEILKALTQLFAIITKQDSGASQAERSFVKQFFYQQLSKDTVEEYLALYDKYADYNQEEEQNPNGLGLEVEKKQKLTSVRDSVKTLGICKKINKTLTQKQKFIALIKCLELVSSSRNFTPQRMQIIDTVSDVFNIRNEEYKRIEAFVTQQEQQKLDFLDIILVNTQSDVLLERAAHIRVEKLDGLIVFLRIESEEMYFVKYNGLDEVYLNGFIMSPDQSYLFSHGSTIKAAKGSSPLYYSDITGHFKSDTKANQLSFNSLALEFKFPNGAIGLRNINISEGPGKLIAIMGGSGAGKTTLLNVLAGIETPSSGQVLINGIDLHKQKQQVKGIIGYVAQDDILVEELTVFQNLYYNAKLCFKDKSEPEIIGMVDTVLKSLGLLHIKHITVGNVLNKKISGGQRKRLNIALELIREPAVMFVDEPTSGLSSRDSENVIDLLKELTLKGKLIFVVIHQPSSDIYKMFDKLFLLDTGGFPIFYGNPIEAITYFKTAANQIDSDRGQCGTCGNVNPEQVFNIVEALVVDEYGQFTGARKMTPKQWNQLYDKNFNIEIKNDVDEPPPQTLNIPSRFKQYVVFTTRDFLSKISNTQYLLINLLEAPLLAFILAFIIRFKNAPDSGEYIYRYNDNIPAFILISIIVALFMGLTVSAEEIIRDRKIQRRENFLNLSRSSYLLSKVSILFVLSALQTITFVWLGNSILDIREMNFTYWMVLFSVSCFANMLGLNISASFNSAVTIYIIIPLLLIPQMILSGAIFNFDKLNDSVSSRGRVPLLADIMVSRWGFEAITVEQYKNNRYQSFIFDEEKNASIANYHLTYLIPELTKRLGTVKNMGSNKSVERQDELEVIKKTIQSGKLSRFFKDLKWGQGKSVNQTNLQDIETRLEKASDYFEEKFNKYSIKKDEKIINYDQKPYKGLPLLTLKNYYFNESLSDLLRNAATKNKYIEFNGKIVQQTDPIYFEPQTDRVSIDYRTHFFAPVKRFLNININTYLFNVVVIWLMCLLLYVTLYFQSLKYVLDKIGGLSDKIPVIDFKKIIDRFKPKTVAVDKNKVKAKPKAKAQTT